MWLIRFAPESASLCLDKFLFRLEGMAKIPANRLFEAIGSDLRRADRRVIFDKALAIHANFRIPGTLKELNRMKSAKKG